MTQTRRPNRQLELPMLSDINGKSGVVQKLASSTDLTKPLAAPLPSATAQDLSVYEQISASYFQSLKKA
jgi:hypothetical protein